MSTYRNTKLIENFTKELYPSLHILSRIVPKPMLLCLLECNSTRLLKRRHAAVADPSVSSCHIFDQMWGSDEISNSPASGIESLSCRAYRESALVQLRGHCCNALERNVIETIVHLIREDNKVVLNAQFANSLELRFVENFTNGVVSVILSVPLQH